MTTKLQTATIDHRYRGPHASGNGGYSAGVLGALIGDCAEVSLRQPPPLDRQLQIVEHAGEWRLLDGDQLVGIGRALPGLELEVPPSPGLAAATGAEPAYTGFTSHPFPECFVCGPDRHEHDGLRLFTGKVDGQEIVASHWSPASDFAASSDPTAVDPRVVWAALDCPSYFGGQLTKHPQRSVLGTLAARILAPVPVGEDLLVIGWPVDGASGRKWYGGAAVYTAAGELLAYARGTWVDISGK